MTYDKNFAKSRLTSPTDYQHSAARQPSSPTSRRMTYDKKFCKIKVGLSNGLSALRSSPTLLTHLTTYDIWIEIMFYWFHFTIMNPWNSLSFPDYLLVPKNNRIWPVQQRYLNWWMHKFQLIAVNSLSEKLSQIKVAKLWCQKFILIWILSVCFDKKGYVVNFSVLVKKFLKLGALFPKTGPNGPCKTKKEVSAVSKRLPSLLMQLILSRSDPSSIDWFSEFRKEQSKNTQP